MLTSQATPVEQHKAMSGVHDAPSIATLDSITCPPNQNIITRKIGSILVQELKYQGVKILRRVDNNYVNATHILNALGYDKGRRTRILDKEVLQGEHERVQGGYGIFQGTWIPTCRALALITEYDLPKEIARLLELSLDSDQNTENAEKTRPTTQNNAKYIPFKTNDYRHVEEKAQSELFAVMNDENTLNDRNLPSIRLDVDTIGGHGIIQRLTQGATCLSDVFLDNYATESRSEVHDESEILAIDFDKPLDDFHHTVLHWAASLGKVDMIDELICLGANICAKNRFGETPLMRSLLFPHTYFSTRSIDNVTGYANITCSFVELIELLADSIFLTDLHGRSILHHVILRSLVSQPSGTSYTTTKAIEEGRTNLLGDMSYSMLLPIFNVIYASLNDEGVKERSFQVTRSQYDTFLHQRDIKTGDTALHLACRLGHYDTIKLLIDAGFDVDMKNRQGAIPELLLPNGISSEIRALFPHLHSIRKMQTRKKPDVPMFIQLNYMKPGNGRRYSDSSAMDVIGNHVQGASISISLNEAKRRLNNEIKDPARCTESLKAWTSLKAILEKEDSIESHFVLAMQQIVSDIEEECASKLERKNDAIHLALEKMSLLENESCQRDKRWRSIQQYAVHNSMHPDADRMAYQRIRKIILESNDRTKRPRKRAYAHEPISESDMPLMNREKRKRGTNRTVPELPVDHGIAGVGQSFTSTRSVSIDEANALLQMTQIAHDDQNSIPVTRKDNIQQSVVPSRNTQSSFDLLVESCLSADLSGFSDEDQKKKALT